MVKDNIGQIINLEETQTNKEFMLNESSVQSKENQLNFSTDRDFLDLLPYQDNEKPAKMRKNSKKENRMVEIDIDNQDDDLLTF